MLNVSALCLVYIWYKMKQIDLENYKLISQMDLISSKRKLIDALNVAALLSVIGSCAIGLVLNYCLRMLGAPGGMYFVYSFCGFVLCVVYIYLHELTHAAGIVLTTARKPKIKFGKFVASCGSDDIVFSKSKYFFVASLPLVLYCILLIPACVFLSPLYFPLVFMPLCYNVFGSMGDVYMIHQVVSSPRRSVVIDKGTELCIYVPINTN